MNKKFIWSLVLLIVATGIISCKKDQSASIEIAITSDEIPYSKSAINVKEIWLNYASRKSNSEWVKLELAGTQYDFVDLYNDLRDTIIVAQTKIDDIKTLIQLRFTFEETGNQVITNMQDTLDLSMSPTATSGFQLSINKATEKGKIYDLRLAIKADSTAINLNPPVFDPSIRIDTLIIRE